jgi:hypothetical protein
MTNEVPSILDIGGQLLLSIKKRIYTIFPESGVS